MTKPTGYDATEYARTCPHLGTPRLLPRSGVTIMVRRIEMPFVATDACGTYPLLSTQRWHELAADLADQRDLLSFVAVVDPLRAPGTATLEAVFPDHLLAFKTHYLARLDAHEPLAHIAASHQRKALAAAQRLHVEVAADPAAHAPDWRRLYGELRSRHRFRGAADFPAASLAAQLALPGMLAVLARDAHRVVSMSLWLVSGTHAHYHLGASDAAGYDAGASFATFAHAFEVLAARGVEWVDLGGSAGLRNGSGAGDGLARFKRGWSSETRTAWLGGRILDLRRYGQLCGTRTADDYFPAYRSGAAA